VKVSIIYPVRSLSIDFYVLEVVKKYGQIGGIEQLIVSSDPKDCEKALIVETNSRAQRMNVGAENAKGEILLFHHPRSELELGGLEYLTKHGAKLSWGAFTHIFDESSLGFRFISFYSNRVRGDIFNIFYLDHCLFLKRELFNKIKPVEIFEDTLLSNSLKEKGRGKRLIFKSKTQAVRFLKNGFWKQSFLNQKLKLKFLLGHENQKLNEEYEKGLELNSQYSSPK